MEDSTVIVQKDDATEQPPAKKVKTESQETAAKEDWEAVERPDGSLSNSKDLHEEGEKIEAPDLADSDGEKVEKPHEELSNNTAPDEGDFELVGEGEKAAS